MRLISILLFVTFIAGCSDTVPNSSNDGQTSSSSVKMNSSSSAEIASSAFSSSVYFSSASQAADSWDGSTAKTFAGGAGTKANPYLIETPAQLAHLSFVVAANDAEYVGAYYRLETDISLKGTSKNCFGEMKLSRTEQEQERKVANTGCIRHFE